MLGTIINTATIVVGTAIGALIRSQIKEQYRQTLFNALGLCCLVLGVYWANVNMAKSEIPVLFILCLAIGGLIGTWMNLSGRIDRLNERLNERQGNENNAVNGLVTGILLYTIGTFSIVGPVLSCLSPSHGWAFNEPGNTFLYTNATLDFVTAAVLAASYGWIMLLAAPVLFCWQGLFYLLAYLFGDGMPEPMRVELSLVGGVLIVSSGLSLLRVKDCKTVNLLPALVIPILFYLAKMGGETLGLW